MTNSLELRNISKHFGQARVLSDVSINVSPGSRTAIVGPSGSGKTTLLRIIAGFEKPDSGQVTLGGQLLADGADAVPAHKRGIGYVPQDGALFPHLNVADNIGFGLARNAPQRAEHIRQLLDMVALDASMLKRRPHELSGGQQQRVALARALAQSPRLMLLDEPFSALDTGLRASTRKAVAQLLSAAGITTILVTHDQSEALSFADHVAVIREGKLIQAGAPADLYARPVDAAIAQFLGDAVILPALINNGWATCALGRIAVAAGSKPGRSQIMLRPEQLQIVGATHLHVQDSGLEADDPSGAAGLVEEIDFGGSVCTVFIKLAAPRSGLQDPGPDLGQQTLPVRISPLQIPKVGDTVRIKVTGLAHVFQGFQ